MQKSTKLFVVKIILLVALVGVVVAGIHIANIYEEWGSSVILYNDIARKVVKTTEAKEETADSKVNIDWPTLKELDANAFGWLYCEGTRINYPVMLGEDNSFYLNHLPDGTYSAAGTLFTDCRNTSESNHLYIYGHCMKNGSMFGDLNEYASQEYYDAHPDMYFITENGSYTLHIYSAHYANDTDGAYVFGAKSEDIRAFYKATLNRSEIDTGVTLTENSKIVTLSTCAYLPNYNRFVVHCVAERSE